MVAKFLDDNKPKMALFQTSSILFTLFNLSNIGEISGVDSERTVSKFTKRKIKFLCCVPSSGRVKIGSFMSQPQPCNDD